MSDDSVVIQRNVTGEGLGVIEVEVAFDTERALVRSRVLITRIEHFRSGREQSLAMVCRVRGADDGACHHWSRVRRGRRSSLLLAASAAARVSGSFRTAFSSSVSTVTLSRGS